VLFAARSSLAGEQAELATAVWAEPGVHRLSPSPLSREAVAKVVRRTLGEGADAGFCDVCHIATGGNPFLTTALAEGMRRSCRTGRARGRSRREAGSARNVARHPVLADAEEELVVEPVAFTSAARSVRHRGLLDPISRLVV